MVSNPWYPTILEKLDRLPPCICRLLAQSGGALMTDTELRNVTGWSKLKLGRICNAKTWERINVGDVDMFLFACGLNWSAQRNQRRQLQVAISKGLDGLRRMRHVANSKHGNNSYVTRLLKRTEKILRENA